MIRSMGAPREQEEVSSGASTFRDQLVRRRSRMRMGDNQDDDDDEEEEDEEDDEQMIVHEDGDWANLQILHHTAKLLELSTRQSAIQINGLRQSLEEKERDLSELRDQLRQQEERERHLVEQNRLLHVQLLAATTEQQEQAAAAAAAATPSSTSAGPGSGVDKEVQVDMVPRPQRYNNRGGAAPPPELVPHPSLATVAPRQYSPQQPRYGESSGRRDGVRLEAPSSTSHLPDRRPVRTRGWRSGSPEEIDDDDDTAGDAIIERDEFLASRNNHAIRVKSRAYHGLAAVRPLVQRRNGMKSGGKVVGYRWRHYAEHPFLDENGLPIDPQTQREDAEDQQDEHPPPVGDQQNDGDEETKEDEEREEKEGDDDDDDDDELPPEEDDYEGVGDVLAVIDLVEDEDCGRVIQEAKPAAAPQTGTPSTSTEDSKVSDQPVPAAAIPSTSASIPTPSTSSSSPVTRSTKRKVTATDKNITSEGGRQAPEAGGSSKIIKLGKTPKADDGVEVPKWRELILTPNPREEIEEPKEECTEEDVSEAAQLRRHAKLELDERRRKRWDSQRVREETYLEKLKRKMEEREQQRGKRKKSGTGAGRKVSGIVGTTSCKGTKGATTSAAPCSSGGAIISGKELNKSSSSSTGAMGGNKNKIGAGMKENNKPGDNSDDDDGDLDDGDILYIRVADDIPIAVFGHPIPVIQKAEFQLPWVFHEDDEDGIFDYDDDDESPPPSPPRPEMGKHPISEHHLTSPQRRMDLLKRKILRRAMKPLQARAGRNRLSLNRMTTTGSVTATPLPSTATNPAVVSSAYLENINEIGGGRGEEPSSSSTSGPDDDPPSSLAKLSVTSWLR